VKTPASELIHAFVGEYRQAMAETRPTLEGMMQSNAAPCRLEADALAALRRLARSLRDNSLFLGFPRLAAISSVLTDVLRADDASRTELVLTPSQAQLLAQGIGLADRIVEIVEAQQREPSTEVELAEFSTAARTLGFAWEVMPFTPASASRREELTGLSDAEKVEQLLVDELSPQVPPEPVPVEANPPSSPPDMVGIFAQDAEEILDHAEQNLLHLEAEPERLHDLLRQFHTLKGNSGLMGYSEMQRISHRLEDVLQLSRDRKSPLGADSVRLFLKAVDALRQCVASLRKGGSSSVPDFQAWLQRVDAWVGATDETPPPPAPAPEPLVAVEVAPTVPAVEPPPVAPTPVEEDAPEPQAAPKPAAPVGDGIRINVERLDQLNDLSSELIAATAVMMHLSKCREGVDSEQYEKACHHLDLITSWLQNLSMSMRMVPVELAFRRLHRLVRDLSEKTGKPIELQLVGGETEADRRVIEFIVDPLVHLVRNAVDHGIESPEERRRLAKPETGTIRIEAFQRSSEVWIVISDDGRGLQRARILEKARTRGLIRENATLREEQILDLIFEPGFSTAESVTEVSGRGVGLDVVRKNVERLRGRVDAQSVEGISTTMTLRIPLTLAVITGMMVRVGAEQFAVPVESIRELVQPARADVHRVAESNAVISLRGETIPLFRLADLFTISGAVERASDGIVVVVEDGERHAALLVDETLGQQRVVVKSLRDSLGRVTGVSGASVLADGRVRLILDVPGLIRIARESVR
jgi:two-component system chemotaxis sensor kinase CheA